MISYAAPKLILMQPLCTQKSVFIDYLKSHISDLADFYILNMTNYAVSIINYKEILFQHFTKVLLLGILPCYMTSITLLNVICFVALSSVLFITHKLGTRYTVRRQLINQSHNSK